MTRTPPQERLASGISVEGEADLPGIASQRRTCVGLLCPVRAYSQCGGWPLFRIRTTEREPTEG